MCSYIQQIKQKLRLSEAFKVISHNNVLLFLQFDTRRLLELYDTMTNLQNEALKNMIEEAVTNSIADILQVQIT